MSRSSRSSGSSGRSSSSGGSRGFSGGMNSSGRSSRSMSKPSSPRPSSPRNTNNSLNNIGRQMNRLMYRRRGYRSPPIIMNHNTYGRRNGGYGGGGGGGGRPSLLSNLLSTIVMIMIIGALILTIAPALNSSTNDKLINTTERKPLPMSSSKETSYYTDELGWIGKPSTLEKGMKEFYKKTGVQPHLYITDNINGNSSPKNNEVETWMNTMYDTLFQDEAHMLLVFLDNGNDWGQWIMTGSAAKSVVDGEGQDFIHSIVDKYATSNLEDEEMFSTVFAESAELLMTTYKSPWPKVIFKIVLLISGVIILIVIFKTIIKKKELALKQSEQDAEILNSSINPIDMQDEIDDLANKYR